MGDDRPNIIPMAGGDWLAVSRDGADFRVGVRGASPNEALANHSVSLTRCRELIAEATNG